MTTADDSAKRRTRRLTGKMVAAGQIRPRPDTCESCGRSGLKSYQVHCHHRDYSDPEAIDWLCWLCHHRLHVAEARATKTARTPLRQETARPGKQPCLMSVLHSQGPVQDLLARPVQQDFIRDLRWAWPTRHTA